MAFDFLTNMFSGGVEAGTGAKAMNPFMQGAGNALSNPDFQKFLTQLGTQIDPKGAGGMIGKPGTAMIERPQQAKAMNQLLKALGGGTNVTGVKMSPDGTLELKGAAGKAEGSELEEMGSVLDEEDNVFGDFESSLDQMLKGLGIGG